MENDDQHVRNMKKIQEDGCHKHSAHDTITGDCPKQTNNKYERSKMQAPCTTTTAAKMTVIQEAVMTATTVVRISVTFDIDEPRTGYR